MKRALVAREEGRACVCAGELAGASGKSRAAAAAVDDDDLAPSFLSRPSRARPRGSYTGAWALVLITSFSTL